MKYLLTTPDGKKYLKFHVKQITAFTIDPKLALQFKSKNEAERFGMTIMGGEYSVVKVEGK